MSLDREDFEMIKEIKNALEGIDQSLIGINDTLHELIIVLRDNKTTNCSSSSE